MESRADHYASGTVPPSLSLVNSVLPVETRGVRLRRYLLARTGGRHGWVNELADATGIKRQTLSAWMGNRAVPDLASLDAIAQALEVKTFEIVAAMDGEQAISLIDPTTRETMRTMLEELLDERDGRQPPRTSR